MLTARRFVAPFLVAACLFSYANEALAAAGDGRIPFGGGRAVVHYPRYHAYKLDDVNIRVSLDEAHGAITGDVTNSVTILHDGTSWIDFDSDGLQYSWVGIAGGPALKYQTFGQTLRVLLPAGVRASATYKIETRYTASPKIGLYFFLPDTSYPHRPTEIWTAGEPDSSRYWFPTYDWPDEKATSETITTVPEGQTVVSNGRLVGVSHDKTHRTSTFTWLESIPHSTYLTAIYAGYFDRVSTHHGSLPISYYAAPGFAAAAADNWRSTPDAMTFFERFNGVRYPWEKYAEVDIQSDSFGSLENVSATMLGGKPHDRRTELDEHVGSTLAHELSHQWWGDYETCVDWGHLWLNEGYATYYEALYRRHALGDDAFAMDMHEIAGGALGQDSEYRRPIVTETYASPMEMFDGTTYAKGGVVLHMLNVMLGDALYRKGQTAFLTDYAAKPVTTAQWEASFERATGRDFSWFVDEWFYRAGYPEYDVGWRFDPATGNIHVHVDQKQSSAWNTPMVFTMPIPIEVLYADGHRSELTVTDNARSQDFTLPYYVLYSVDMRPGAPAPDHARILDAARPATIIFDAGGAVFGAVNDHATPAELRYRLRHATALVDRLNAFEELPLKPENLPALTEFLRKEHNDDARAEALGSLRLTRSVRKVVLYYLDHGPAAMRVAASESLGTPPADATSIAALESHAAHDESYATMAAAIASLGRLHAASARQTLLAAVADPMANGDIASAALGALARLDGRRAIPLLERYSRYGAPADSRPAAVSALARAGAKDPAVAAFIERLLDDKELDVKYSAAAALGRIGVATAIAALQRDLSSSPDLPFYRNVVRASIASLEAESHGAAPKRAP